MGDPTTHRSRPRTSVRAWATAPAALVLLAVLAGCDLHTTLVRGTPTATTPHATNGDVRTVAVAGDTVVVGGSFTSVTDPDGTPVARRYLMAFDRTTGRIRRDWDPVLDNEVYEVVAAADGQSVYVGGRFNNVDGVLSRKVARISVATGERMPFQSGVDAVVTAMALQGDRLYIGGVFGSVQGRSRRVAALDAETGVIDDTFDVAFQGTHRGSGDGKIWTIEPAPNGRYLMVVGSFATVDGLPRNQVVKITTGDGPGEVSPWSTAGNVFAQPCASFDFYVTDVAISPDSSYFVITTTGAKGTGTAGYCDSASRWENNDQPGNTRTWVQYSGADSLYSVEITSTAVYIGGHQRWSNNSFGSDNPGPGAVETPGIASHDPYNGLPLSWNPGRDRGRAVWQMLATSDGLYVVSDTDRIAGGLCRGRIAFFPLAGGAPVRQPARPRLPVAFEQLVPGSGGSPPRIVRRTYDGTTLGPPATLVADASALSGVRAAFLIEGVLYTAHTDDTLRARSFDGTTLGPARTIDLRGLTAFAGDLGDMLGMLYDQGKLHYTRTGTSNLFLRYFSFEQELVGAERHTVATGGHGDVGHMAAVGSHAYWVNRSTRALMRSTWSPTAGLVGPATVVSPAGADGIDWRDSPLWVRPLPAATDAPPATSAPSAAGAPAPDGLDAQDGPDAVEPPTTTTTVAPPTPTTEPPPSTTDPTATGTSGPEGGEEPGGGVDTSGAPP